MRLLSVKENSDASRLKSLKSFLCYGYLLYGREGALNRRGSIAVAIYGRIGEEAGRLCCCFKYSLYCSIDLGVEFLSHSTVLPVLCSCIVGHYIVYPG